MGKSWVYLFTLGISQKDYLQPGPTVAILTLAFGNTVVQAQFRVMQLPLVVHALAEVRLSTHYPKAMGL
jgi:hypothetical protein